MEWPGSGLVPHSFWLAVKVLAMVMRRCAELVTSAARQIYYTVKAVC